MINYAPDGMAGGGAALLAPQWSVLWSQAGLPAERLAANTVLATKPQATSAFEPERISGLCASS